MNAIILFPSHPLNQSLPDESYKDEYNAALSEDMEVALFDLDEFLISRTLKLSTTKNSADTLYRGWMVSPSEYKDLYEALLAKGYTLLNTPAQYENTHYLVSWYSILQDDTPKSVYSTGIPTEEEKKEMLSVFKQSPVIIKDYVKSRKHEWEEAFFIQDASKGSDALKVIDTFIKRQGDALAGGIILREYLELQSVGRHPISNTPIFNEVRVFLMDNRAIAWIDYWSGKVIEEIPAVRVLIDKYCSKIDSRFFTMDFAQKENGKWVIIEIGDGQVSGLQEYPPEDFYHSLTKLKDKRD